MFVQSFDRESYARLRRRSSQNIVSVIKRSALP